MSDSIKWLFWILGLVLLLWMGIGLDSCRESSWEPLLCAHCVETGTEVILPAITPPSATEDRLPIDFSRDNSTVSTNLDYDEYRARILEGDKEGQILEITGSYYEGEVPPEEFDNMGVARASAIRDLLKSDIPVEKIILKSNLIATSSKNKYFAGHSYQWISEQPKLVEQLDGCTIIRFDFNSSAGNFDAEIVSTLDKIAARVRATGEKITITGHTDDIGEVESNKSLGLERAMDIRREFISRKVLREQISPKSEGETESVASNDSDRGRAENRRVEVCLSE